MSTGDIVLLHSQIGTYDLYGDLATVARTFRRHGQEWAVLAPYVGDHAGWPCDTVTFASTAFDVVWPAEQATAGGA